MVLCRGVVPTSNSTCSGFTLAMNDLFFSSQITNSSMLFPLDLRIVDWMASLSDKDEAERGGGEA